MACSNCCKCSARELVESEVKEDTAEEEKEVAENGFVMERRCTDVLCLIFWAVYLGLFVVVTFMGFRDGNPAKLYKPRDYQGAYCGVKTNWNNGPDLESQKFMGYMMNVTSSVDAVAKQFICSTSASDYLATKLGPGDYNVYLCECCLTPCEKCAGSLEVGGDITGAFDPTDPDFSIITDRMRELTNPANALSLWSTTGANGGVFKNIWSEATKYFIKTCITQCNLDLADLNATSARTYTYKPAPDQALSVAWEELYGDFKDTPLFSNSFTFKAFPEEICPYDPEYCVPMPGVELAELYSGWCTFKMGADLVNAVGSTAASAFVNSGTDSFVESLSENIGGWWGDFTESIDTFIIVCVLSVVIGIIYLVILRFTVKFCVWFAVIVVFFCFVFGGAFAWVRSVQCKDAGIFETGTQAAVAVAVAGKTAVTDAVSGGSDVSEECKEADCSDYRGRQVRTRSGYRCQSWDSDDPHSHTSIVSSTIFPDAGLGPIDGKENIYCRNPYNESGTNKARSIWCYTTDPDKRWELCTPIGIISPECQYGHAVNGENMRLALAICSYVLWALSILWVVLICCFARKIRLAIALNEVAAKFVAATPSILVVPVVQAIVGCIWVLVWMLCASFLLSQVPDGSVPKDVYSDYSVAYGTNETAGKCTGSWPTGFVWKAAAEKCTGSWPTAACWRCGPPRYAFDWRFAVSFFAFLWNNAFLIALGQCIIAGAVGVWFFTPNDKKGSIGCGQALRKSNYNVWRYHAGSLAFGAFILALIQFIRYVFKYLEENAKAQKNRVLQMIYLGIQCCLKCFERFIKFLNKNAYIQVAIRGTPFCSSAKKAFWIILNNMATFGIITTLGSVIHSIGYIFIMAATLVVGYFLLKLMHDEISPVIPMIVYAFMSYIVGSLFMNVFGLAVDTSLQCILFAQEKCPDGDNNYVPDELRKAIGMGKEEAKKDGGSKEVSPPAEPAPAAEGGGGGAAE